MERLTHKRRLGMILIVVVVSAVFWGLSWRQMNDSILTQVPILDEAHYLRAAHALVDSGWATSEPYYMSPLYTWLVAATGSGRQTSASLLEGAPPWGIRVLQALMWIGVAWMLRRAGLRLLGPRWGWAPPVLWVLYRPAAVLASQVLMEVPLTFFAVAAVLMATGDLGPKAPRRRALLAGVCVGAAALLRGTSLILLLPVLFAFWDETSPGAVADRRRTLAAVLLAMILMMLPATLHNSLRSGRLCGPSLNGGVNLYIGNWSGANGFFFAFSKFDVERDPGGVQYLAAETGENIESLAAADARWASKAREAVFEDPGRFLALWAKKVWLHGVGIEIPQISSLATWTHHVGTFRLLVLPYALLAIGGLSGAVFLWRRRPDLRIWVLMLAGLIAFQSLFFVTTRYRLVLVPALALLTSSFMRELLGLRGRQLALGLAVMVAASLAVAPWGLGHTRALFTLSGLDNEAVRWFHVAEARLDESATLAHEALDRSETLEIQALAADSTRSQPWLGLARARWLRDDRDGAMTMLKEGLGHTPDVDDLLDMLIRMQLEEGRPTEAIRYVDAALKKRPNDRDLLHLAVAVSVGASRGRPLREAESILSIGERAARHAVALDPLRPESHFDLGLMLANLGRYHQALESLDRGLTLARPGEDVAAELARLREGVIARLEAEREQSGNSAQDRGRRVVE